MTLDTEASCEDALSILVTSGHSRAPVADGADLDDVVGVVHLRDLVAEGGTAGDRAVPPMFIPETVGVLEALRQMQVARQQLAVVIDEHGAAAGIITIEDLVEELVGEIYDETDPDVLGVEREADGSLVVPGRFPIHDLSDIGVEVPEGGYATLAGLLLETFGRIPAIGDRTMVTGWEATILDVTGGAISRVRLTPHVVPSHGRHGRDVRHGPQDREHR